MFFVGSGHYPLIPISLTSEQLFFMAPTSAQYTSKMPKIIQDNDSNNLRAFIDTSFTTINIFHRSYKICIMCENNFENNLNSLSLTSDRMGKNI